ncbi:MAG: hypothetical protein HXY43_19700 [Fischerella sp.]|jgi:hypothetical protein|nr:hypothetical protein [Fischerella sp.]
MSLFRLACVFLKYFLLALVGLAIAYVLSSPFGGIGIAAMLFPYVVDLVMRFGIVLFCVIATTIIFESVR